MRASWLATRYFDIDHFCGACYKFATMISLWTLSKGILVAVLLALPICLVGIAWIDYDVPGAWPDLIGPSETWRVEGAAALECAYRPGAVVGSHGSSPWTIWPGPLCRQ